MKRFITIALLIFVIVVPVHAQSETPYVIRSTRPISAELRAWLDAWLATDAPSNAPYYIVTNVSEKNGVSYVSMAGVNLSSPDAEWLLESETTVWIGTVVVQSDGTVSPFIVPGGMNAMRALKVYAKQLLAAGGGSYVAFPFQSGTAMIYGPRAVHGSGDYGTSGMLAVDLIGGDDLGSGSAPPYAYASDAGVIDYVCDDGTTVAVRTYNSTTEDYFVYAHLLDNENLVVSSAFSRGELLGGIKYGSFDDECGWAEQQEDHYHIHWMFTPANGAFQAEDCILIVSTRRWTCGTTQIGTGGWLLGGGGTGTGLDDVTGTSGGIARKSFWDYFIAGLIIMFDKGLLDFLPEHQPIQYVFVVVNTISLVLRISHVLLYGNISLQPLIIVIGVGFAVNAFMSVAWIVSFILKTIKSLVPLT